MLDRNPTLAHIRLQELNLPSASRRYVRAGLAACLVTVSLDAAPLPRQTPMDLYEAARDGDVATVSRLLEAGVDPDATPGRNWQCALWVAANQGYLEIVEILLGHGAELRCGTVDWPPLAAAARGGHLAVVKRLLQAGAGDPGTLRRALAAAADDGHPRTAKALVTAGALVDAADEAGVTPLHRAARAGRPETVRVLLDSGAKIEAADAEGRTALHWASWLRQPAVVRLLIARGASPDKKDLAGDTALLDAPDLETAVARMERATRRAASPAACQVLPLSASAFDGSMTAWGAPTAPKIGAEAWAIPLSEGPPARMRVTGAERESCAGQWFDTALSLVEGALRGGYGEWLVIFDTSDPPQRISHIQREDLPWGVFPATVKGAIDLDADGRPDGLVRSFCCKVDWLGDSEPIKGDAWFCDYTCWDSWWRGPDGWVLCAEGGPC